MKHLVFSLPYGIGFRNIVCCGVLDACLSQGATATLLIPALGEEDERRIRHQLPRGVDVRALKPAEHSFSFTCLKLVKQHLYARRTGLASFRVKHDRRRRERPVLHVGATFVERLAERICSEDWIDRRIEAARQPHEAYYRQILQDVRADVVILAKPGYQPEDLALIQAARAHRVRTISVDTTWDNIVSKRPTYLAPDELTAWSRRMQEEAVSFYRLSAERVPVTGGAAFDVFFSSDTRPTREAFLQSMGLDPRRRLMVFTLNNPIFNPQNSQLIRFLLESVRLGAIHPAPNVVVRMHPWDRESNYEDVVRAYPRVHLERPFGVPERSSAYECIPSEDEVLHYGALMTHADAVMNIGSTTSLDAIAADTPVVNIAFDIDETPSELSVARFYDYTHYKPILESKAVRLVRDRESFFEATNGYLRDRGIDSEFRARARKDFLTFDDGLSAGRVATAIVGSC